MAFNYNTPAIESIRTDRIIADEISVSGGDLGGVDICGDGISLFNSIIAGNQDVHNPDCIMGDNNSLRFSSRSGTLTLYDLIANMQTLLAGYKYLEEEIAKIIPLVEQNSDYVHAHMEMEALQIKRNCVNE
jgi:hypothetical protein